MTDFSWLYSYCSIKEVNGKYVLYPVYVLVILVSRSFLIINKSPFKAKLFGKRLVSEKSLKSQPKIPFYNIDFSVLIFFAKIVFLLKLFQAC